jgi:peptidoglycan-associated lipoprotein
MMWRAIGALGVVAILAACEPAESPVRELAELAPASRAAQLMVMQGDGTESRRFWVFFEREESELPGSGEAVLRAQTEYLAQQQARARRIVIEGYADEGNTQEARDVLAQERADAVRQFLVRLGFDPQQIAAIGVDRQVARPGTSLAVARLAPR